MRCSPHSGVHTYVRRTPLKGIHEKMQKWIGSWPLILQRVELLIYFLSRNRHKKNLDQSFCLRMFEDENSFWNNTYFILTVPKSCFSALYIFFILINLCSKCRAYLGGRLISQEKKFYISYTIESFFLEYNFRMQSLSLYLRRYDERWRDYQSCCCDIFLTFSFLEDF